MPPNRAISHFIITVVILFFAFIIGLLMKARYRLPSELKADEAARVARDNPAAVPKAIPVGQRIYEPLSYKSGAFWVLSHPELSAVSSGDAGTLRVKNGPKEDVFVLYGVDAVEASWSRPGRLAEQAAYFDGKTPEKMVGGGAQAQAWVAQLLRTQPFIVYTKWIRVPETERYYAFVRVEMDGKQQDLGELLVKNGFATPKGVAPDTVPEAGRTPDDYRKSLQRALSAAKADQSGLWAQQ